MIEFLFVGTILSYLQFNQYIDELYKLYNTSKDNDFLISRGQYISIYLYQYINALLLLIVIIYSIYFFEYVLGFFKKGKQYKFIFKILELVPHYKSFFAKNDLFLNDILIKFLIGLIINLIIILLIRLARRSNTVNNKNIIKQDVLIYTITSFIINVLLYLFL